MKKSSISNEINCVNFDVNHMDCLLVLGGGKQVLQVNVTVTPL